MMGWLKNNRMKNLKFLWLYLLALDLTMLRSRIVVTRSEYREDRLESARIMRMHQIHLARTERIDYSG